MFLWKGIDYKSYKTQEVVYMEKSRLETLHLWRGADRNP
jgi:hypothetical protein